MHKVTAFKEALSHADDQKKETVGTQHGVVPLHEPDAGLLQQAVDDADYRAFYLALSAYEEPLRRRTARRIERHPQAAAELGQNLTLDEITEEVFLLALERFERRPQLPLGIWLEQLIDDAIRAFVEHPEEERENVRFAQTLRETPVRGSIHNNGAARL